MSVSVHWSLLAVSFGVLAGMALLALLLWLLSAQVSKGDIHRTRNGKAYFVIDL